MEFVTQCSINFLFHAATAYQAMMGTWWQKEEEKDYAACILMSWVRYILPGEDNAQLNMDIGISP